MIKVINFVYRARPFVAFTILFVLHLSALGTGLALASSLDCLQIRDNDRRHFCIATTKPDKLECEFIRNRDLKAQCRAVTPR